MTTTNYQVTYNSPLGPLLLMASSEAVYRIEFTAETSSKSLHSQLLPDCLEQCIQELTEYFAGTRLAFNFPVQAAGTTFQQQVWQSLLVIPYGQTISYQALALKLNNPGAIRAIGSANGKNQLLIVRPCHRVVGSNGQLVGYAGGLWRKKWLLNHERTTAGSQQLALF